MRGLVVVHDSEAQRTQVWKMGCYSRFLQDHFSIPPVPLLLGVRALNSSVVSDSALDLEGARWAPCFDTATDSGMSATAMVLPDVLGSGRGTLWPRTIREIFQGVYNHRHAPPVGGIRARQGSDIDIFSGRVVRQLGILVFDLPAYGFGDMEVKGAWNSRDAAVHFAQVGGITGKQWALIREDVHEGTVEDTLLLPGLSW
ncbi:hypothetical protein CDV31_012240 [Fusarium ambrosium]|uniref:Uncharacterized protein n=1 Tax=Fusarium ambrosium TaxID=131363 RepID=A0A428TB68_9HYPO|nr:hypothetical protein CDV31_012240 [Fusarium ambrosium]